MRLFFWLADGCFLLGYSYGRERERERERERGREGGREREEASSLVCLLISALILSRGFHSHDLITSFLKDKLVN